MICQLTSILVVIFLLQSTAVDAKAGEFIQIKVYNHDFRVSDSAMHAMLMKANLMKEGFKKEVTTKLVQEAGSGKPDLQKAYFFYKVVNCTEIKKVEQDLQRLLPDVVGKDVDSKFQEEIKYRHLDNKGQCIVGLEVHFKKFEAGACHENQKAVSQRRKKRFLDCFLCWGCVVVNRK